jgi:hypothetical protein
MSLVTIFARRRYFGRGSRTRFFYAWQKGNRVDQLPRQGDTDVIPWLQALAGIGYHGWVTPFMRGEEPTDKMPGRSRRHAHTSVTSEGRSKWNSLYLTKLLIGAAGIV